MRTILRQVLIDCLPTVAMCGAVTLVGASVIQVSLAVQRAREVHVLRESIVAQSAAWEAALISSERLDEDGTRLHLQSVTGMLCSVHRRKTDDGSQLIVDVRGSSNRYYAYQSRLLSGGAPAALGHRISLSKAVLRKDPDLACWLGAAASSGVHPLLAPPPLLPIDPAASVVDDRVSASIVEDHTLALLRLPNGTDLADFRLAAAVDPRQARIEVPRGAVLRVPGHLWVNRGEAPLCLNLENDLTILVSGNIYLDRSIHLHGPGRLVLMATPVQGQRPLEGSGSIFLGLPGEGAPPQLIVPATLVSHNDAHLHAREVEVQGALVLCRGLVRHGSPTMTVSGNRRFRPDREAVPGFATSGRPRPGVLRPEPRVRNRSFH